MFIVYEWNWGWYKTEFEKRSDAEHYLVKCAETARVAIRPAPYMTNENGKRIYTNFEIKEKLHEFFDFIDYHNKNLTKKQYFLIEELKEMMEGC